jgi:hypothetical protein
VCDEARDVEIAFLQKREHCRNDNDRHLAGRARDDKICHGTISSSTMTITVSATDGGGYGEAISRPYRQQQH